MEVCRRNVEEGKAVSVTIQRGEGVDGTPVLPLPSVSIRQKQGDLSGL